MYKKTSSLLHDLRLEVKELLECGQENELEFGEVIRGGS